MAAVSKSKGFEALGEIKQWVLLLQASEPNEPTSLDIMWALQQVPAATVLYNAVVI